MEDIFLQSSPVIIPQKNHPSSGNEFDLACLQDLGVSPVPVDSLEGDENSGRFFSVAEVDFFLEKILRKQLFGNKC